MGTAIDTGGHKTRAVYSYCKPRFGQHVFAIKGAAGMGKPLASRPSTSNSGKVKLFTVGTETGKDTVAAFLSRKEPGPGYCHFPAEYDKVYFDQLLAERPIITYRKGQRVRTWQLKRPGARNETLDCRVYSMAALEILGIDVNETVRRFEQQVRFRAENISVASTGRGSGRRVRNKGYGEMLRAG